MSWDTTTPGGSEAANNGDNRIRELKVDIQTALRGNAADGTEAKFPGADAANPVFRYRGLKGTTGARPASADGGLYINTTLGTIQRDNGAAWEDIATLIPAGTVMVFYQAAAPTGFTKIVTQNDKALRVVSGGSGGSASVGGQGLSVTISLAHTHAVAAHTHTIGHKHKLPVAYQNADGDIYFPTAWAPGKYTANVAWARQAAAIGGPTSIDYYYSDDSDTANSGSTAPATDSKLSDTSLAYVDVILASKD